jgi:hypothetical protein
MASFLRGKVSKNKKRFKEDGFDLDLTCTNSFAYVLQSRILLISILQILRPESSPWASHHRVPKVFTETQSVRFKSMLPSSLASRAVIVRCVLCLANLAELLRFYEKRHKDVYKLYNLYVILISDSSSYRVVCCEPLDWLFSTPALALKFHLPNRCAERVYDPSKFHDRGSYLFYALQLAIALFCLFVSIHNTRQPGAPTPVLALVRPTFRLPLLSASHLELFDEEVSQFVVTVSQFCGAIVFSFL